MARSILVVEDDTDTRETLEILLAGPFNCRSASSRDQALRMIKGGYLPGCILMDYSMPGMSLEEFMEEIRPYNLELVLTSAHADAEEVARLLGIKHTLIKPIRADELLTKISTVVGSGEHAAI